jgi:hypothetical protein
LASGNKLVEPAINGTSGELIKIQMGIICHMVVLLSIGWLLLEICKQPEANNYDDWGIV